MPEPYRSAREHLDEALALVSLLIERQILAHWEQGILPRIQDEFSGTFISDGEASALLSGGRPASEPGQHKLATLDAALAARAEAIEARLLASRAAGAPMPFDRLRSALLLTPTEQRALWVLIAIEVSARLRGLMRYLVNEASRIHADIGLLDMLVYDGPETRDRLIHETAPDSPLFRHRLVEPVGGRRQAEDAPFLLRPVRVNRRVIELVHGVERLDREVAEVAELITAPPSLAHLLMPETLVSEVVALVRGGLEGMREGAMAPVVVLAGQDGAGRTSLVLGTAHALGCAVLRVRCAELPADPAALGHLCRALVREALLFRAVPLLHDVQELAAAPEVGRPDRARTVDRALLGAFPGPVTATCPRTSSRPVVLARGIILLDVPVPGETARKTLWQRALGDEAGAIAERAAARYAVTGGVIERSARAACTLAAARGGAPTEADVHAGLRSALDAKLSALGVRITWRQTWDDLVLPDDSMDELRELIARVRHQRRVYQEWGFGRKLAKGLGLSALFSGPPGTGKTMVAGLIADELALDLYQIDLSRIVSKYVGETEKNLANLFDAAEAGHAILLFDEADSLFAKRTEVKSSIDRYANLEVNYLLQRMETFNGITILTTNMDSSIDEAFRRRLSFRIHFPMPEPEDRERLWRAMLPAEAEVAGDIDFDRLADKYAMSGGYIRNAVLRAAFLAADESQPIGMEHLARGATLEYAAMGKVITSRG